MSKIKTYIWLLLAIFASFQACKKNAQDFNYKDLNDLSIKADSNLNVTQFDTLKITPQLTEARPDGSTFTYQWKIYPTIYVEKVQPRIISTERNLGKEIALPPDTYTLEYKVTNTKSGVATFKIFTVEVSSFFKEGWLVSNSKDGQAQLSFIRSDSRVFFNPAALVNQTTYQGNALGAFPYTAADRFTISFFTSGGIYRLDADDFLQFGKGTVNAAIDKDNFTFGLSKFTTEEYLINGGSLYAASTDGGPLNMQFSERISGDYILFPKVISSSFFTTYFYDNKYRRFMFASFGAFVLNPSFGSNFTSFNMGNTKLEMVGAMDGAKKNTTEEYFFIMQDGAGARYLYSLSDTQPGLNQKILNSPDIAFGKSFAASLVLKQIYYATDNKIYLYDMLANSAKLIYTFPSDIKIKQIQMQQTDSKTLVVATNKGTAGEVYFFGIDNLGNFSGNTYAQKYDGFGEIANIAYRKLK